MVGHMPLEHGIGVRVPVPQLGDFFTKKRRRCEKRVNCFTRVRDEKGLSLISGANLKVTGESSSRVPVPQRESAQSRGVTEEPY